MLLSKLNSIVFFFISSPLRRATIESVITGFAAQVVLVVSGILVARILGAEGRGFFAMLVLFPIIISQFGALGLPNAITYYLAANRDYALPVFRELLYPFIFQTICFPIIHAFILLFYLRNYSDEVTLAGYFSLFVIPGMLSHRYGLAVLQGMGMFRSFNILRILPAIASSTFILLIFLTNIGELLTITISWVFVYVSVGIITLWVSYKKVINSLVTKSDNRAPCFKEMLQFGIKGLVGAISPFDSLRLDQLIAGLLLSPTALGLYSVSQAFMNLPRFFAQSASMVLYPAVGRRQGKKSAHRLIWGFFIGVLLLNGLSVFFLLLLMPIILPFLFGEEFSTSISIAQILLIGGFCVSLRRIIVEAARGLGKPEISTWSELTMYPAFAIIGYFMINSFGLKGLSISVSLCYFLSLVVSISFIRRFNFQLK